MRAAAFGGQVNFLGCHWRVSFFELSTTPAESSLGNKRVFNRLSLCLSCPHTEIRAPSDRGCATRSPRAPPLSTNSYLPFSLARLARLGQSRTPSSPRLPLPLLAPRAKRDTPSCLRDARLPWPFSMRAMRASLSSEAGANRGAARHARLPLLPLSPVSLRRARIATALGTLASLSSV